MQRRLRQCFVLVCVFLACAPMLVVSAQTSIVWTASSGPFGGVVKVIVVDPHDPTRLYAGTPNGLYLSMDRGASWKAPDQEQLACQDIQVIVADPFREGHDLCWGQEGVSAQ